MVEMRAKNDPTYTATFFLNEILLLLCIFASLPFIPEFSGLILIHIVREVPHSTSLH